MSGIPPWSSWGFIFGLFWIGLLMFLLVLAYLKSRP